MSSMLRQHVTNVPHPQHLLRRQLSAAGKALRREFYMNNPDPTLEQEHELNVAISRLPGCAWYKDERKLQANYTSSVRGTRCADGGAADGQSMNLVPHLKEATHSRPHHAATGKLRRANGTATLAILLSTCPNPDCRDLRSSDWGIPKGWGRPTDSHQSDEVETEVPRAAEAGLYTWGDKGRLCALVRAQLVHAQLVRAQLVRAQPADAAPGAVDNDVSISGR
ncbi:predicted protein [Postia placenta Mad-698-R]|nr:predicted protein [Postia placenta Mad-698-R]